MGDTFKSMIQLTVIYFLNILIMKQFIKTTLLLLAILLPAIATAHDFEVDGICYKINGNEATVTS